MGTLLIFRTGAAGSWGQCETVPVDRQVRKSHMYQLNAAAKAVIRHRHRWYLLDVEQMTGQFECPHFYLRDSIHMNPRMTWTVLNQYVNMLHTFWDEHGMPEWRLKGPARNNSSYIS